MADTRVKIVDLQVNVQSAIAGIAQYNQRIDEAKEKQKQFKQELKNGTMTQEQYQKAMAYSRTEMKANQSAVNDLNKQVQNQIKYNQEQVGSLNQLKLELQQAKNAYNQLGEAERNGAKGTALKAQIQALNTEIKSATVSTSQFYQRVGNPSQALAGINSLSAKFKSFAQQIAMMAAGGGLVAFSREVINTTRSFEDGMAHVQSIVNGTGKQFDALKQKAIELGEKYRYTAIQAAGAEEMLARNGLNAEETVSAVGQTLRFAQANAIDLAEAADIMTNNLNASGLRDAANTQEELEHNLQRVSDVMSRTAATSATNVSQLGEAMVNALPISKTLGNSIEETSAQLATLADNGIKGSYAGTQIRMILNGLANQTSKQQATFKALGVDINETTIRSEGLTKTFEKLRDAGVLKLENRMQILGDIFGKRVAPAAIQLIEGVDRTKKHLEDLNGAMDETNAKGEKVGTTARMFGQSYSTMGVAIDALRSAWEHLQIMMGESQMGGLTNVVDMLHDGVIWVADNIPTVTEIVKAAIAGITFTKLAQNAVQSFQTMRNSAVSNAEAATKAVQTSKEAEQALNTRAVTLEAQLNKQRAVNSGATAQQIKLTESQLAATKNQLAITSANTQKLQATEVAKWNQAAALTTGNSWKAGMAAAGIAARGFVMTCKTAFKGFIVTAVISLAFEALMKLWDAFNSGKGILGKFGTWVKQGVGQAVQWVSDKISQFIGWLQKMDNKFAITGKVVAYFSSQIAIIGAVLKSVWSIVKWWANNVAIAFKGVGQVAQSVGTILKDVFTFKWGNIGADFKALGNSVAGVGKAFVDNTKNFANEIKSNVNKAVSDITKASETATKSLIQPSKQQKGGEGTGKSTKLDKSRPTAQNSPDITNNDEETTTLDTSGGEKSKKLAKEAKKRQQEAEKAAKARQKAADTEQKALDEAEKAELALLRDTAYKRRQAIEQQYDSEIRKLKSRLKNERNLTATARDAINRTIVAKEQKKQMELAKLSDEELKNTISREQKLNEARLAVVRKGTADELALKQQSIEQKRRLDQLNLNEEEANAKENSSLNVEAATKDVNIANQNLVKLDAKGKGAGDTDYDSQVKALEEAKQRLAKAQEEQTSTVQYYKNLRASINEKARQDQLKAEQEYQQQLNEIRIQGMENQLAQLKLHFTEQQQAAHEAYEKLIAENERRHEDESQQDYEARMADLANDQEYQQQKSELKQQMFDADMQQQEQQSQLQRDLQALDLDVTTEQQMKELEMERDIARQKYGDTIAQGQLEGETQEEYDARVLEANTNFQKSNEAINNAEQKNEQAKLKAFQSVGDGIVSVLNAVGDENSAAAKIAKVITLAQIAIDTGKALSAGIASASSLPYPANLAAIATTVATVLANVATAISTVKSAKFAEGGKVVGPGTGTSDSISASLSNGEYVMTAKATRLFEPLLATMNQIGAGVPIQANNSYREVQNTDAMTEGFSQVVQNMPRPVVSVEEITDTQNRVETIQTLDNF